MNKLPPNDAFYKAVSDFLLDERLNELRQKKSFNVFDVLKISRTEIRHSNVLAWLLNPNEDHGLGSGILKELVLTLIKHGHIRKDVNNFLLSKYEAVTVYRERKDIDVLIESAKDKFVVCIENKIDTTDHSGQLNKYSSIVNTDYPNHAKVLLYLTPNGDLPTEETNDNWACVDYACICNCIENALKHASANAKIYDFIQYYIDILRREIMGENKDIKELCCEIYRQHKDVLDMIYEYRPDDVQNVSDIVADWCQKKLNTNEIIYDSNMNQSKCYHRFKDEQMDRIIKNAIGNLPENKLSGWKGYNQYFYEIVLQTSNNSDKINYYMQLALCSYGLEPEQIEKLGGIYSAISKKDAGGWKDFKHIKLSSHTVNMQDDSLKNTIHDQLDNDWNSLKDKISKAAETKF